MWTFDGSSRRAPDLVIGLGNPILTDDGVGLHVIATLRGRVGDRGDVDLAEDTHGGLRLMERLVGYRRAIIVDAIRTGAPAGTIFELTMGALPTAHSASSHDASLSTALAVGRAAGAPLPEDEHIRLVAIEAADVHTLDECCTPAVRAAIPRAVDRVCALLDAPHWPEVVGGQGRV